MPADDLPDGGPKAVNRILKWLGPAWVRPGGPRPYGGDDPADRLTDSELSEAIAEWDERARLGLATRSELGRLCVWLGYGPKG